MSDEPRENNEEINQSEDEPRENSSQQSLTPDEINDLVSQSVKILQSVRPKETRELSPEFMQTESPVLKKDHYPLDQVDNTMFNNLPEEDYKRGLEVTTSPRGAKKETFMSVTFDFNSLAEDDPNFAKINKRLNQYDKRVLVSVGSYYLEGYPVLTLTDIYRGMVGDFTKNPSQRQKEKINQSLHKLHSVITVTNPSEVYESKYPKINLEDSILTHRKCIVKTPNGKIDEGAIYIPIEPLPYTLARLHSRQSTKDKKPHGELTSFESTALNTPLELTPENLAIEDYCIQRITRRGSNPKIRFAAIADYCKITTTKQRQRLRKKVLSLFERWRENEIIKDFTVEKDGVTVIKNDKKQSTYGPPEK